MPPGPVPSPPGIINLLSNELLLSCHGRAALGTTPLYAGLSMRVRHLMPASGTNTDSARPGRIQIAHTSSSPVPFQDTTGTRALHRGFYSITTWHDQSPCSPTLLPGHLRAAFGALLLRTRLSGRVRFRVSTLGTNTIATRSGGVRAAHASSTISLCHDFLPFCTSVLIELLYQ